MNIAILLCLCAFVYCAVGSSRSRSHPSPTSGPSHDIYNERVVYAERMERPLRGILGHAGIPHAGVRVTTENGQMWFVHKTKTDRPSDTVVTYGHSMRPEWRVKETKHVYSERTIRDFVQAGGPRYNLFISNCLIAARRMMDIAN